jgi:hypothetical protein
MEIGANLIVQDGQLTLSQRFPIQLIQQIQNIIVKDILLFHYPNLVTKPLKLIDVYLMFNLESISQVM